MWREYLSMKTRSKPEVPVLPRFGLTGDIVAYRRCPRQYGYFVERGFVPAHTVQIFYGTVIHEVLDRAHRHYQGFDSPATKGKIPTDKDIEMYFSEVESSLKAHGIRAINLELREQALNVLRCFNRIEGARLYPLVVDTEHRVRGARENYLMEGVVDVLVGPDCNPDNRKDPSEWQIWDYKAQRRPREKSEDLQSYVYQMRVYAALFELRNACLPKAAKLYFLNELLTHKSTSPDSAVYEVSISKSEIEDALSEFDLTAREIEECVERRKWDTPSAERAREIKDTCVICDLRWSCPSWESNPFPMHYP